MMTKSALAIRATEHSGARGLTPAPHSDKVVDAGHLSFSSSEEQIAHTTGDPDYSLKLGLEVMHAEWFHEFDAIDRLTCAKDDLLRLHRTAPHDYLRGMLNERITMRIELAALTGREFN